MPPTYHQITEDEFEDFIIPLGFVKVSVPGAMEHVYGKIIGPRLCLRVFSSVTGSTARKVGADAIRVAIVYKDEDGKILPVGKQGRVNRTQGWKENLKKRIDLAVSEHIERCHCGRPMSLRENRKTGEEFWGCVGYITKKCSGTKPV